MNSATTTQRHDSNTTHLQRVDVIKWSNAAEGASYPMGWNMKKNRKVEEKDVCESGTKRIIPHR